LKKKFKEFLKRKALRLLILQYYRKQPLDKITDEIREVLEYLKHRPVNVFPYTFKDKYKVADMDVKLDTELNLFYVMFEGKRMYYKDGQNKLKAKKYFRAVISEQDPRSPHRYLVDDFNVEKDEIVVDIGAAEGIFGLMIIDKVSKLYLFEPDNNWHKALHATFKPWENKIEIVPKMVSDLDSQDSTSLDRYFANRKGPDFIKIDVDGVEEKVIMGSRKIFNEKKKPKVAICTYHFQEDAEAFSKFFKNAGFSTCFSRGYMIYRVAIKKPYLRRGVLRAWK
jgi:hypothetical protein